MLREIYLKIQDSVRIQVLFVTPGQEDTYAASSKQRFLKGNVDVDLEYTKNIRIRSTRLQEIWRNTEMCVLKPESSWVSTLRTLLFAHNDEEEELYFCESNLLVLQFLSSLRQRFL
jgi:hypothetical protein